MNFDLTNPIIVYPSWTNFSYAWNDLPALFANPLETKYLRAYTYNWVGMGYSMVTNNFSLVDGPFGNGIIRYNIAQMTDTKRRNGWLPEVLLGAEARLTMPPGFSPVDKTRCGVNYLSPKPSDEVRLGLEKWKQDSMPYFSVEPSEGLDQVAFLCVCASRVKKTPEELLQLPFCLKAFGFESEFLDDEIPENEHELIVPFSNKWNLTEFWFFVDLKGMDCGMLLAALVYLGGHFKQKNSKLKSFHIVTSLAAGYEPMCSTWTMQKLR